MTGVAVVFPGQGSQYPGMADAWSEHPAGNDLLKRASGILGWDVVETSRDGKLNYGPFVNQQALQMDDFAQCVREGRESRVAGEMGRRDLCIIEAVYAAMKSGNAASGSPLERNTRPRSSSSRTFARASPSANGSASSSTRSAVAKSSRRPWTRAQGSRGTTVRRTGRRTGARFARPCGTASRSARTR